MYKLDEYKLIDEIIQYAYENIKKYAERAKEFQRDGQYYKITILILSNYRRYKYYKLNHTIERADSIINDDTEPREDRKLNYSVAELILSGDHCVIRNISIYDNMVLNKYNAYSVRLVLLIDEVINAWEKSTNEEKRKMAGIIKRLYIKEDKTQYSRNDKIHQRIAASLKLTLPRYNFLKSKAITELAKILFNPLIPNEVDDMFVIVADDIKSL